MSSSLHSIGTAPHTTPTKRFEAAWRTFRPALLTHYEARRIAANIAKHFLFGSGSATTQMAEEEEALFKFGDEGTADTRSRTRSTAASPDRQQHAPLG
jgi:hypothetical protein